MVAKATLPIVDTGALIANLSLLGDGYPFDEGYAGQLIQLVANYLKSSASRNWMSSSTYPVCANSPISA